MRVAALDLGKVRVGLAVSDDLGALAHPREPLDGRDTKRLVAAVAELVKEEGIERILVGHPLDMRGGEGSAARRARDLAQRIADAAGCDVELVDERLTTVEASRRMREGGTDARRGRSRVDGAAAAVLLQAWLDGQAR
jgi:putative Holliday junction resolvase